MINPIVHQKIKAFIIDGFLNLNRLPIIDKRFRLGGRLMIIHPRKAVKRPVLLRKKLVDQKFKK